MTGKQQLFVTHYIGDARGNAAEAARLAGYADPKGDGYRTKNNAEVQAAIQAALQERTLSGDEVLERLTQHANGTMQHFIYVSGDTVTLDLGTPAAIANLHLLKKVKTKRRTGGKEEDRWEEIETEIELHDPQAALVHLGRFHKLFTDRQEVTGQNGGPILITSIKAVEPTAPRSDGDHA